MAFSAVPATLGVPGFGIIHINPEETAKAFQVYLDTASKITGVSLDDINRGVINLPQDESKVTLVDLLSLGMKLFDAIVWLTAGRPGTHKLQVDPTITQRDIPTLHEIARSVFYCYFLLLTQARYPAGSRSQSTVYIPNFLKTIMGMGLDQKVYMDKICSFDPQKFDPAWIRFVKFDNFGQEVLSRFGLGVAGYRMFSPFKLYAHKPNMDRTLEPAYAFAKAVATAPASWNVHPLTRDPNILTKRGNLNKNLGNLMLEAFTPEDLNEMKAARIIYDIPAKEAGHRNYKTWTAVDDISGQAAIF